MSTKMYFHKAYKEGYKYDHYGNEYEAMVDAKPYLVGENEPEDEDEDVFSVNDKECFFSEHKSYVGSYFWYWYQNPTEAAAIAEEINRKRVRQYDTVARIDICKKGCGAILCKYTPYCD